MAIKRITLRAWSDNSNIPPQTINQGDILSRTVLFTLHDSGGTPIDLTQSTARVHFSKPDGKVCYLTASIVNAAAGMITVTLDSQCTAVPGTVKSIVQVTSPNGENLYIIGPLFAVGAINVEGSILSANEFTALTDALKEVKGIANEFTALMDALKHENKADLNVDGKVIQDPASYGQANGGATLNADGKVIQNPASYGVAGGAALNPSTLPTEATIVKLSGGSLLPAAENTDYVNMHSGTFTPYLKGSATAGEFTYFNQAGQYTVIGDICIAQIFLKINTVTTPAAGHIMLGGLPKIGKRNYTLTQISGRIAGAEFVGVIGTDDSSIGNGLLYNKNGYGYPADASALTYVDGFCCTLVYKCLI